ncbi:MAG: hypothetical protein J0L92_42000 [Deltaproteobacteria bacterium]|nr:hypothetical protein [Deltaproteobacteria bacterium]
MRPLSRTITSVSLSSALALAACEGTMTTSMPTTMGDAGPAADASLRVDAEYVIEVDGGPIASGDAGTRLDAAASPALHGVFVAVGYVGRSTISCDDGRSWTASRSEDESLRCWEPNDVDCDHQHQPSKAVVFDGARFVRSRGWGDPGGIEASEDGVRWSALREGTTFGGLAYGDGVLVAGARTPERSDDGGETWTRTPSAVLPSGNVRRVKYLPGLGLFVLIGDDGSHVRTSTNGTSWDTPSRIDARCGQSMQWTGGVAELDGAIVIAGHVVRAGMPTESFACVSRDGGETFDLSAIGPELTSSEVLSDGEGLVVYSRGARHRTTDGRTWTNTPLADGSGAAQSSLAIGAIARSPDGTFVAANAGWKQWYERQRFYRSTDGVRWTTLSTDAFAPSHAIRFITWGEVAEPEACR